MQWIILCYGLFSALGNNRSSGLKGCLFTLQICIERIARITVEVHTRSLWSDAALSTRWHRYKFVGWWGSSIYALHSINRMQIGVIGENIERQPDGKEVSVQTFPAFRIMDWEWGYKLSEGKLSSLSSPVKALCWRQQCLTKCMVYVCICY